MNHLEPLSWHGSSSFETHQVKVLAQQQLSASYPLSLCSTFGTIATLFAGCRRPTSPTHLAVSMHAVVELARITFALAGGRRSSDSRLDRDCARCLHELEQLADALSSGAGVPAWDRAHALDTLIVLLVQIGGANDEEMVCEFGMPDDRGDPMRPVFTALQRRSTRPLRASTSKAIGP